MAIAQKALEAQETRNRLERRTSSREAGAAQQQRHASEALRKKALDEEEAARAEVVPVFKTVLLQSHAPRLGAKQCHGWPSWREPEDGAPWLTSMFGRCCAH